MSLRFRKDIAVAAVLLGVLLALTLAVPAWRVFDRKAFDAMTVATAPGSSQLPIVLVAIDESSMRAIGKQWPWPRSMHAQLVDRIAGAGAAAIALDLIFYEPSTAPAEDEAFAAAIRRAGNIVLAADFVYSEQPSARLWQRKDPLAPFLDAGAIAGFASIPLDADNFVRRFPGEPDAFWRQILKVMQLRAPSADVPPLPRGDEWIRYLGDDVHAAVPYSMVLEATADELRQVFQGRIVIVGRDVRASPEIGRSQPDLFATPFLEESGQLTPGIRLHATMVDNALSGAALRPAPRALDALLEAVVAIASLFAFRRWRPFWGGAWLALILGVVVVLSWSAFTHANIWMSFVGPVAVAVSAYLAFGARAYFAERRRKREMQAAFSRYVSPHLVAKIARNPAALGLGGERREVTVMFTDLAGFTALTERSDAETVAAILVKHFTAMTGIVMERGGTVVNFMGDGMMCFWGAPLDDAQHALHAVEASIEMQRAMAAMPEIRMRIGVNTCTAIVGNMGSASRLAYTAMGDGVNLASRLEGANKAYGTGVLLSETTAKAVEGRVPLVLVDRVRVSGKQEAVAVYTPEALADVEAIHAKLAALRGDAKRVAADGSVALEKL